MDKRSEDWRVAIGNVVAVTGTNGHVVGLRARKARALVAYLAMVPARTASRAELIALLWSDRGRDQARASLRQCLFELRGEAPGLIDADGETVALAAATVAEAPCRNAGTALADLDALDPAFDRWLATWRTAACPPPSLPAGATGAVAAPRRPHRWRLAVAAGALLVAAVVTWWSSRERPAAGAGLTVIAVGPFAARSDPRVAGVIAERMRDDLRQLLPAERAVVEVGNAGAGPAGPPGADWVISGSVDAQAGAGRVYIQVATADGQLIWARDFDAAPGRLADAAAIATTRTAFATGCALGGPRVRRDVDVLGVLFTACERLDYDADGYDHVTALAALQRLADRAPDDALAQAYFGTGLAVTADDMPPAIAKAQRGEALRRLDRAARNPRVGEVWLGRFALVEDDHAYALKESLLARGLAVEPTSPSLNLFMGELLAGVGRGDEGLVFEKRAVALAPAFLASSQLAAGMLSAADSPREAFALLDAADRRFPDNARQAWQRLDALLTSGNTKKARALLDRANDIRGFLEPEREEAKRRLTYAMDAPHGELADAVARDAIAEAETKPQLATRDFNILTQLGRTDAAIALALRHPPEAAVFFRLQARPVLLSPQFPLLARRAGLWAYWTATGHWPDICTDPALGWRCPVKSPSRPR